MYRREDPKISRPLQIAEREKPSERPAKRSRSASYSSVSTISTSSTRSRSRSPLPRSHRMQSARETAMDDVQGSLQPRAGTKRGRSYSASPSAASSSRSPPRRASKINREDRNTRRRHSSVSPAPRGRALYERGRSHEDDSYESSTSERQTTRRRKGSIDRSRVARERASYTPEENRKERSYEDYDRDGRVHSTRHGQGQNSWAPADSPGHSIRRDRSLSPFSKRVALTKAMNAGPAGKDVR